MLYSLSSIDISSPDGYEVSCNLDGGGLDWGKTDSFDSFTAKSNGRYVSYFAMDGLDFVTMSMNYDAVEGSTVYLLYLECPTVQVSPNTADGDCYFDLTTPDGLLESEQLNYANQSSSNLSLKGSISGSYSYTSGYFSQLNFSLDGSGDATMTVEGEPLTYIVAFTPLN